MRSRTTFHGSSTTLIDERDQKVCALSWVEREALFVVCCWQRCTAASLRRLSLATVSVKPSLPKVDSGPCRSRNLGGRCMKDQALMCHGASQTSPRPLCHIRHQEGSGLRVKTGDEPWSSSTACRRQMPSQRGAVGTMVFGATTTNASHGRLTPMAP